MKADYVKVKGINFLQVLSCTIYKKINEHGTATIKGIIEEDYAEECMSLALSQKYVEIFAEELSGKKECIFIGYIDNLELDCGGVKKVTVNLYTGSKLLDLKHRTRTFQDVTMTHKQVIQSNDANNKNEGAASIFLQSADNAIGNLITQYKETDWEFAIRVAAMEHGFIRPAFTNKGAKYFYGLRKEQNVHKEPSSFFNYKVKMRNTEYEKKKAQLGWEIEDAYSFLFSSRQIYEVGDCIRLDDRKLYVYKVTAKFEGQELVNRYELRTWAGFKKSVKYNHKLIGASLPGTVLSANRDKIKMNLDVDKDYQDHGVKEFMYSTVYSSPDGTGWYCMPEKGDYVRLYFPTEREKDAYTISSVHLEVSTPAERKATGQYISRTDPNEKTFSNPAGKEIVFTESSILINNPAVGSILLDDNKGIIIDSDKSIQFKAMDYVEIHSTTDSIGMNALTDITLEQGANAKFSLNDSVYVKGSRLKIQQ